MTVAIGIIIAVIICLLAIGIPYWRTHRRLRAHGEVSQGRDYLNATGKTPEDAAAGRPGSPQRRQGNREEQAEAIRTAAQQDEIDAGAGE